ncbi:type II toxin-antitoxin system VapC family toxin [bacterium CPR1]|nr:type II toxin-antitoxin system VapC family toxin [bacterium CPR1]
MRLLLDTCAFLWLAEGDSAASPACREAYLAEANEVLLSSVSAWEIAVKFRLGKLPLPAAPDLYVANLRQRMGVKALPLVERDALHVANLPDLHKDPFDRMLVCQALLQRKQVSCLRLVPRRARPA